MNKLFLPLAMLFFAVVSCDKVQLPGNKTEGPSTEQPSSPTDPVLGEYEVKGTVMYDDGRPAVGLKVSDGFSITLTDSQGGYRFTTAGKSVKYIYISYPSDARIVADNGVLDFYQKYESSKHVYDFALKRQAVEQKFAIFALADPQAHYQARGTQMNADTDRFAAETVPAVNAQIASHNIPCYGITLGDIAYSEGSRDSTPSMEIMKGHLAKVNMPVFNIMGNHDFTYYEPDSEIFTSEENRSVNLLAQRAFEQVFGPVNYSFDRGNIHFVCMKNIVFESASKWDGKDYRCGFTDKEYSWLQQDLANTPKTMKVILCVHIPISTNTDKLKVQEVQSLLAQFDDSMIFSGHTHYQQSVYEGDRLYEQIHPAVCGQWWWSNISGDGCPNGYTIYHFDGKQISDSYFIGVNKDMNSKDYQMRMYKGDLTTGGKYARFKMPYTYDGTYTFYMINVFNGDSKWTVKVFENGVYAGTATLLTATSESFSSVSAGTSYDLPFGTNKDWWAIGYHIGVCGRGTSSTSFYTLNYHMWCWASVNTSAKITVEATDPHGNTYTCDEMITDGEAYPDYIKAPLNI